MSRLLFLPPRPVSAEAPPAAAEPTAGAGGPKPLPVILAIVAGLALGGGAGAFGVGPALASGIAPSPPAAHAKHHAGKSADADADSSDAEADDEGDAPAEKKGGKEGTAASVYTIDNLVLNPAGSGGTRFLLLSIAFEMKDAGALESIKTRDAELRDAVLVTLGSKTVEQLSEMTARDSLKTELRTATAKALHTRAVRRVYFPQFVIQ